MRINWLLLGAILLLIVPLFIGCGIPQEDYDAVIAERDKAQAEVSSLQSELDTLESKVERTKNEVETLKNELAQSESDLANAESNIETLENDLAQSKSEIETLESNLNKAERQIDSLRSDLALTEEQLAKMEIVFGKLLFFDDFEDGDTEGWNFGPWQGWSVIQEGNNYLLQAMEQSGEHIHADIIDSFEWTDYTLEFRIKVIREGFWVNFKAIPSLSQRYILGVFPGFLILHKSSPPSNPVIAQVKLSPQLSEWNDIKIAVEGSNIKAFVNGVLKINYTDPEFFEMGGINFEVGNNSHLYLDNVLVMTPK